jgi:hypothetical protein
MSLIFHVVNAGSALLNLWLRGIGRIQTTLITAITREFWKAYHRARRAVMSAT